MFALVIAHAFFYGALLRTTSPFTLLLGLSVIAVLVGQAVGVWLWRRRNAHVGQEIAKLSAHLPATIRVKEAELGAEERRLGNFVDFIGEGRGSRALAKALLETERRVEVLREELDGLRRSRPKVFQSPPPEMD